MKRYSIILLAILITSCGVERKIRKAKAIAYEHPKEFAEFCATVYPVIPTYVKGKDSIIEKTVTVKGDSIPCPENEGKVTYVKCPDAKVIYRDIYRVDTVVKESTAKLTDLNNKLSSVSNELIKVKQDYDKKSKLASNRLLWLIILGVLLIGSWYLLLKRWLF